MRWTHNDALIQQIRFMDQFYRRYPDESQMRQELKSHIAHLDVPDEYIDERVNEEIALFAALMHGETFYIEPGITKTLLMAANELPETSILMEHQIPYPSMFVCLDRNYEELMINMSPEAWAEISAMGHVRLETGICGFALQVFTYTQDQAKEVSITGLFYNSRGNMLFPGATLHCTLGSPLQTLREVGISPSRPIRITDSDMRTMRFIYSLMYFIEQDIVKHSPRYVNRATQRRLRSSFPHEPVVRVIELRRARNEQREIRDSESIGREYDHQWLVRGHWRNQWYPSLGIHQPKWIAPYVKGPDDAPFKPSRATVHAVVR